MTDQRSDSTTDVHKSRDESAFADGDLGRVQALLFGDHARQSRERVDTLEQALLGAIADLRDDMTSRLTDLEKQIATESENRTTALSNLGGRLTEEVKTLTKADSGLKRELAKTSQDLSAAIDHAAATSEAAVDAARKDLAEDIARTNTSVRKDNVDRTALAGMMAALAEQLSDEDTPTE